MLKLKKKNLHLICIWWKGWEWGIKRYGIEFILYIDFHADIIITTFFLHLDLQQEELYAY